jgi:hypothetical protein
MLAAYSFSSQFLSRRAATLRMLRFGTGAAFSGSGLPLKDRARAV